MKKNNAFTLHWIFNLLVVLVSLASTATGFAQGGDYAVTDVKNGGTITGTISFTGKVPTPKQLVIDIDAEICAKTTKVNESLLVEAETKGVKNVVVSLKGINTGKDWSLPEKGLALFLNAPSTLQKDLDGGKTVPKSLQQMLKKNRVRIDAKATVSIEKDSSQWLITDKKNQQQYRVKKEGDQLNVYGLALNQNGCQFRPHVFVVPAARPFYVLNNDGIMHNLHTYSKANRAINKAQPRFMKALQMKSKDFKKPETIRIACDVHSWMKAWIVTTAHPYYAVTDAKGNFAIDRIPPGSYTLELWHERLGEQSQSVSIAAGGTTPVEATYTAPK
jgi:hypothetical protein